MQATLFFLQPTLTKYCQKQNLNLTTQNYCFFTKSQLVVSNQKTEYIVFSTRKRLTNTVLNVDNEKIAELNRVTDLKLRNEILPVSFLFEISLLKIFFRLLSNDLPAYKIQPLSTMRIKHHERSRKITFDTRKNNTFLTDFLFAHHKPFQSIIVCLFLLD